MPVKGIDAIDDTVDHVVIDAIADSGVALSRLQARLQASTAASAEMERIRADRLGRVLHEVLVEHVDEDGYVTLSPDTAARLTRHITWRPSHYDVLAMLDAGAGDSPYARLYRTLRGIDAIPGTSADSPSLELYAIPDTASPQEAP